MKKQLLFGNTIGEFAAKSSSFYLQLLTVSIEITNIFSNKLDVTTT